MYVLGIKPSLGSQHRFLDMWGNHDPGAALLEDGEVISVVEEERFTRQKRGVHTFPRQSIRFVLDRAGIGIEDVDVLAIGRDPRNRLKRLRDQPREFLPTSLFTTVRLFEQAKTIAGAHADAPVYVVSHILDGMFEADFSGAFECVSHHRSHAASAAYCADTDRPAVVTVDGQGEHDSTVLWNRDLTRAREFPSHNSIGHFYTAGTNYLGYDHGSDAGKVMGLASYGEYREEYADAFDDLTDAGEDGYDVTAIVDSDDSVAVLEDHFGPAKSEPADFEQRHRDFAYHLQLRTEEMVTALVRGHVERTGTREIAIAGGVGMNCKLNREILNMDCVDDLFIQPAANDSGICLGAALEAHRRHTGTRPAPAYDHVYFGTEYTDDQVRQVLEGAKLEFEHVDDICATVADLLADGKLVGWFQGQMEYGARALGNRSILANPTDSTYRDQVNENVKHRESWRPFAPSLLAEARDEYLVHGDEAPYMILLDEVLEEKHDEIPAVTHVDGTTRPQTVTEESNPRYHRLISEFADRTGVPVVLNTSFNVAGEPIVESPAQAVEDFYSTGLDALAVGDYLLAK
jgi:carbamoyltransferase